MSWAQDCAERHANAEIEAGAVRTDDMQDWPDLPAVILAAVREALERAAQTAWDNNYACSACRGEIMDEIRALGAK